MSKPKTIRLVGVPLSIAMEMCKLSCKMWEDRRDLAAEFQQREQKIIEVTQQQLSGLWTDLMHAQGIPVDDLPQYQMDARYLEEHGIVFLQYTPAEEGAEAEAACPIHQPETGVVH